MTRHGFGVEMTGVIARGDACPESPRVGDGELSRFYSSSSERRSQRRRLPVSAPRPRAMAHRDLWRTQPEMIIDPDGTGGGAIKVILANCLPREVTSRVPST